MAVLYLAKGSFHQGSVCKLRKAIRQRGFTRLKAPLLCGYEVARLRGHEAMQAWEILLCTDSPQVQIDALRPADPDS